MADEFRDPGEPPALDWIDKDLIEVDPAYQRSLDDGRVQRILDWFAWDSFGALVVAPHPFGGKYSVIDGQHRLAAAKLHPKVSTVPAVIINSTGTAKEAETFVVLNRERKNVTALELYWAQLAAGDADAETIKQVAERAGITILRTPPSNAHYRPSETVSISAIRGLVDRRGAMRGREILEVLAGADLAPIRGEFIRAAELLLTDDEFKDDIDAGGIKDALSGRDEEIATEGKAFAKTHRMASIRALASVWYRRTRKKRRLAA